MRSTRFRGLAAFGMAVPRAAEGLELSPIKAVELRASRLPDVVSLAQGIPSFDTPEPIKRYAAAKIAEGACAKYSLTPGLPQLRELISESLLRDGMRYDPDGEIIVTCGAIEAISATLLAFVEPGDEVLIASPTYASYIPAIRLAGATPRFVALNEDANFDLDPEAIGKAVSRHTRAILLSNPNNPTGTIYSAAETARMMALAARHDLLVITDEVYKDFIYTSEPPGNPATLPEHRERVVRVCSFSKAYGMTGWRVGYLHTARRRADAILTVHDALVTCAPVVSQYAAIAALAFGEPFVEQFRAAFRQRRARIIERLDALPQIFDYQQPNASYFAFPRLKDTVALARDSRRLADDILERARVAVVPGVAFGPTGEAHLRFCYARELADIDRAFDRLTDYFAGRAPRTYSLPAPAAPAPERHPLRELGVQALHALSRLYLARSRPRVVAIAGGRGKTVLKRTLAELLGAQLVVRSNPLSYNTDVGLAFAVLDTSFDTRRPLSVAAGLCRGMWHALFPDPVGVLVLEFGVRQRGDMRRLLRVVRPDVAIVTALAPSYSEDQAALATLRAEMKELIDATQARGAAVVVCVDDSALADFATTPLTHRFSRNDLVERDGRAALRVDGREYGVGREIVGESSLYALSASVIVAQHLGVDEEVIREFLAG
jgi:aminotransferase